MRDPLDGQLQPSPPGPVARQAEPTQQLLLARLGERVVALPVRALERILRMAALTPVPEAPREVVGVLDLHGIVLPVVDPRPRFGLPSPPFHPEQHLVVVSAATRYLLWIDRAERILSARASDVDMLKVPGGAAASQVVRLEGMVVTVLSPEALDPGPIVQQLSARPQT